jgi:hypothetical protein
MGNELEDGWVSLTNENKADGLGENEDRKLLTGTQEFELGAGSWERGIHDGQTENSTNQNRTRRK